MSVSARSVDRAREQTFSAFDACIFCSSHLKQQQCARDVDEMKRRKKERMKKKLKRKCKKKTKFSCSYCYIHSWLLFLFGCSCCLFLAHIHPAQFICRLLLFIMLESYTTSRRREMQYCVFIVCTYCCELFLFPPIFSMCLRYVGRIV